MSEYVKPVMVEKKSTRYVPPQAGRCLEIELVPVLLELTLRTILPGMTIRKCSGFHKRNTVSTLLRKNEEAMIRI